MLCVELKTTEVAVEKNKHAVKMFIVSEYSELSKHSNHVILALFRSCHNEIYDKHTR